VIVSKESKRRSRNLRRILWGSIAGGAMLLVATFLLALVWPPFADRDDAVNRSHSTAVAKAETTAKQPAAKESSLENPVAAPVNTKTRLPTPVPMATLPRQLPEADGEQPAIRHLSPTPADKSWVTVDDEKRGAKNLANPGVPPDDRGDVRGPDHRDVDDQDPDSASDHPSQSGRQTERAVDRDSSKSGIASAFSQNPNGDTDGLRLADGTEVRFPPDVAEKVTAAVALKDRVTIKGWIYSGESEIHAATINNDTSGKLVVVDRPPPEISGSGEGNRQGGPEDGADDGRPPGPPKKGDRRPVPRPTP